MNKITSFIAKLGTNPYFIAANAHFWFLAYLVSHVHNIYLVLGLLALAAFKEFYFDAKYETPKQTWLDNVTDFAGYAAGIALGWFF